MLKLGNLIAMQLAKSLPNNEVRILLQKLSRQYERW